jgi:hypothetical protein
MRNKLGQFKASKINRNAFSKPLALKACYWAGFIAADGNLRKSGAKEITLALNIKDKNHLFGLKNYIKYRGKIRLRNYLSSGKICRISFTNAKIYDDLMKNFNIIPKKSLILNPPKNLTNKQSLAYIIGYIDGDGYITSFLSKGRTIKQLKFDILGTKELLFWIKEKLSLQSSNLLKLSNKNTYRLSVGGNIKAGKILRSLKKVKVPKLQRKWRIV